MISPSDYDTLLDRFDRSAARLPLADNDAVLSHFMTSGDATWPAQRMGDRLQHILASGDAGRFNTHNLKQAVAGQLIGNALGQPDQWAAELDLVAGHFGGGSGVLPPDDDSWDEAADLGRALFVLNGHCIAEPELRWPREIATARAAGRLRAQGSLLSMAGADLIVDDTQLQQATAILQKMLDQLGFVDVAGNALRVLRERNLLIDGIYVAGRQASPMRTEPSTPYNLLLQLAVRASAQGTLPLSSGCRSNLWTDAVQMARDIAAVLQVESHGQAVVLDRRPSRLTLLLRETGLFDALFSFRQWPAAHSRFILEAFYRGFDDEPLRLAAGWGIADALDLLNAVLRQSRVDPSYFDRSGLIAAGAPEHTIDALLSDLAHPLGQANAAMMSPTEQADLMFRPLLEVERGIYTQIAAPLAMPAFYEGIQARIRGVLPKHDEATLRGDGTERAVAALFARAGLHPVVTSGKYNMGKGDEGECDLVFANDAYILFVEVKAKAVSRKTQTGAGHAALLDVAGAMLKGQLQGIGHERVLRSHSEICFLTGLVLPLNGRKVVRASVTLLDHAGLQDRIFIRMLLRVVLNIEFGTVGGLDTRLEKQIAELNADLRKGAADLSALDAAGVGEAVPHLGGSVSAGHLAVMLADTEKVPTHSRLRDLIRRLTPTHTYVLFNPFAEYLVARDAGLFD